MAPTSKSGLQIIDSENALLAPDLTAAGQWTLGLDVQDGDNLMFTLTTSGLVSEKEL